MRMHVPWIIRLYLLMIWTNGLCDTGCREGFYGQNCDQQCGECRNGSSCNDTGQCPDGCRKGWKPEGLCNTAVNQNCRKGSDCVPCGHCKTNSCTLSAGLCSDGCAPNWLGIGCFDECPEADCFNPCNCRWGCQCDYQSLNCTAKCSFDTDDTDNSSSLDKWIVLICLTVTFVIPAGICLMRCCLYSKGCTDIYCCCCDLVRGEDEERHVWTWRWRWHYKDRRKALRPFVPPTETVAVLEENPSSPILKTYSMTTVTSGYRWKKKWILRKEQIKLRAKKRAAMRKERRRQREKKGEEEEGEEEEGEEEDEEEDEESSATERS